MIHNKICVGDEGIFRDKNSVIHSLGTLDWGIYNCITDNHVTDEVIVTEEQLMHIRNRHPEAYQDAIHYVRDILDDPDYIRKDKRPNTGLVVKRIFNEKRLNNYLRNKDVIYKKE